MTPVPDVIALGETMRSVITVRGQNREHSVPFVTHGGAESNACVALVRLGFGAAWVSRLGTDAAGDLVMEELRAHGVDLRWVRRDPERPTGSMFRQTMGGPPVYERAGSAASALEAADLDGVPVERASAVLVTGITAMLGEGPQRAAIALLERARGLRVVDPNLRRGLWGSDRASELIRPLVERADILIGGEAELAELVGGPGGRALAERCRDLGPREVVLKRGAGGAAALTSGWTEHRPPPRRDLDPVGAGDAFNAGYLAARLSGGSVEEALEQAARCGAEVASTIGDTRSPDEPKRIERQIESPIEEEVSVTRDARQPPDVPEPKAPYSPVVVGGPFAYTSGQVAFGPDGTLVAGGVEEQTRQVLDNVERCLASAGCSMDDVVKVTAFLNDLEDFPAFNRVYEQRFAAPYPARSTVGARLADGLLVEIEAVALLPQPG